MNKRNVMKNAWSIRKSTGVTMSTALKAAWALEKSMCEAETIGQDSGWNYKVNANDWVKSGYNRTYVATRIYTNAWSLKKEVKLGYVNNLTGEFVRS